MVTFAYKINITFGNKINITFDNKINITFGNKINITFGNEIKGGSVYQLIYLVFMFIYGQELA